MVVTTMASISSLANKLRKAYPNLTFKEGEDFRWAPQEKTIYYPKNGTKQDEKTLLHELAHALLEHVDYDKDVELLHKEREAWDYASKELSKEFDVEISEDDIEEAIESYRDWLHSRSTCPKCSMNGLQEPKNTYKCLSCGCSWRANDARICELRRYKIDT